MDVVSRGHRLHADVVGEGPPLLLVSGHLQAAEDWQEFGYPARLGSYRLVAVDPLGYGDSDKPRDPDEYRLDLLADDLAAVLDGAGVDRVVVWGYSRGAILTEAFATCHPDRVRAVVLGGMLPGLSADDRRTVFTEMADAHRALDWPDFFDQELPFVDVAGQASMAARNDREACAAAWEGTFVAHRGEEDEIEAPTFVYVGDGEWFRDAVRDWAAANGAEFALVEGRDHGRAFRDADAVVPLVDDFLRRHAA